MKRKIFSSIAPALLAAAFLASCSNDDVVQNGQDNNNTGEVAGIVFEGATQTPASRATRATDAISATSATSASITGASTANAATRTTLTHTVGGGAKVFWETTDHIWVKDDGGTWQQSSGIAFPNPSNKGYAKFGLTTGSFTGTSHQLVYTGTNSTSATEVEIKANQTQSAANNFDHAGTSGDCGIATATGSAGKYAFSLDHKAAYLCLLPRTENPVAAGFVVKSVTVQADNDIAGTFALSASGLAATPTTGGSKSIKLTVNNLPLASTTSPATNACYIVMAPQTTALNIIYELYDAATNTTGTVTKNIPSNTYAANTIYDITSNLVKDYTEQIKPYMWDAKKWYYDGKTAPYTIADRPQSKAADPDRWYNDAFTAGTATLATNSCKDCPTNVQLLWYIMNAPYDDANELWTADGKIYKGVMRFKRWADLVADDGASLTTLPSITGTTSGWIMSVTNIENAGGRNYPGTDVKDIHTGIPAPSLLTKYFAVPGRTNGPAYYWSGRGVTTLSNSIPYLSIAGFALWVGTDGYIDNAPDSNFRVMKFE